MTLVQCLIIAALGYASSIYAPWLALGGWYTLGRPLIAGLACGIILGDIQTGIILGCAVQTLFIGLVTPGGSMPADVNFAAWIGIPLAMVAGGDFGNYYALTLAVPLSFLGVLAVLLTVTINSVFVHRQDRLIADGKLEQAIRIPVVGQLTNFVVRFFPIFLCTYFGAPFAEMVSTMIPIEVVGILAGFGKILPLIGFAILLKYVYKKPLDIIYYLIGFLMAATLKLPIVPVVIVAALFAYFDFNYSGKTEPLAAAAAPVDERAEVKRLLSKKDVFSCYRSWLVWNLSVQNMERMEGPAIIRMLGGVKDKLYPGNREKQKELLERHEPFFNTEPYVGCLVPGVVLGMEEENARNADSVPAEMLTGVKTALMGPFAGIGDSLYVGTLIPILLSIALGISSQTGSVLGPVFYIVAHLGIMIPVTWLLFYRGYSMGLDSAQSILASGIKDKLTRVMNIVGLTVVGAITAQTVDIQTSWVMRQGEEVFLDMNQAINSIFPNLITLLLALATFWLMTKKKVKMGWMFLIFLGFAVVALLTGLMTV